MCFHYMVITMAKLNHYLYDSNHVRYQLVKSDSGKAIFNWIFIPGGPGCDSSYFIDLINELHLPGNCWLIDFPANGSNLSDNISSDYDFNNWDKCFISAIQCFDNPIIVGHSFGGMFPLLFPALENILKGFVILNSAPSLWLEEAEKYASKKSIPLLNEPMSTFENNPNQETFKTALVACAPYYFSSNQLETGIQLLNKLSFNFHAAVWWLKRASNSHFTAQWIPENVPTLIIGGSEDCITPISLFENDNRFARKNIQIKTINGAGHFPWLENIEAVKASFDSFLHKLTSINY